jgi:quercetin dioxygenase-like cupin family protein
MMSLMRLFAILFAAAATLAAQNSTPIENDQVRVVVVKEEPHIKTRLHDHKVNRVMIYLDSGKQDFDYEGKRSTLVLKAGEPKWSPASGMHTAELTSANSMRIVEVELKKPAPSGKTAPVALDPLKTLPKYYKLEFENDQVRVFRVKIPGHASVPLHEHASNRVLVCITGQNFRVTTEDGKVVTQTHKAGEVSWGAPTRHKEENLNAEPFEALVVEPKS